MSKRTKNHRLWIKSLSFPLIPLNEKNSLVFLVNVGNVPCAQTVFRLPAARYIQQNSSLIFSKADPFSTLTVIPATEPESRTFEVEDLFIKFLTFFREDAKGGRVNF